MPARLVASEVEHRLPHIRRNGVGVPWLEPAAAFQQPKRRLLDEILSVEFSPCHSRNSAVCPPFDGWKAMLHEGFDRRYVCRGGLVRDHDFSIHGSLLEKRDNTPHWYRRKSEAGGVKSLRRAGNAAYNWRRMTTHITRLLHDWSTGDDEALNILMPLVHRELRQLARQHMRSERHGHTLQATALVSEAYLRLLTLKQIQWEDRDHFFAVAARLMRRILVDAARARDAEKRGFGTEPVPLDQAESKEDHSAGDLLFVDEALRKLQAFDARKAQVVELRVFMGLSVEETAAVLRVSVETVKRDWRLAKAWLKHELEPPAFQSDRSKQA